MSKMESLLLDKNKKMEHELTQLKVKLSEKTSLLETAEGKIVELAEKVNEQQKLIQKLEDDILKGYSSKEKKGTLFDDWDLSESGGNELSEVRKEFSVICPMYSLSAALPFETVGPHMENTDQKQVSADQDQSSMLKVICNQRDRFRARLRETEEEIRQLKEKIGELTTELEKTKADNVKLYGKIRYVQDYNQEKVISRGSKKYAEDLESGFTSDVESKYKKIYEDDINPFAAFSKKVTFLFMLFVGYNGIISFIYYIGEGSKIQGAGLQRQNHTQQRTFSSGKQCMHICKGGNHAGRFGVSSIVTKVEFRYARTFAFFYTIGLHILVFTCLYRMSALSYLSHGSEETAVVEKNLNLPRGY
ncbi:hypothetical protein Goarm_014207 [Gossypium armourianum]|uniref:CASP C-terminal domain-containing protein n=1 Tax=Gossypium armourianum TaxID=34283 RepID=A0A7J9J829_9ROSI|nr:hypothetical protein [Gossypium armourianum]